MGASRGYLPGRRGFWIQLVLGGEKVVHISLQEDVGVGEFVVYEKLRWWKGVKVGE